MAKNSETIDIIVCGLPGDNWAVVVKEHQWILHQGTFRPGLYAEYLEFDPEFVAEFFDDIVVRIRQVGFAPYESHWRVGKSWESVQTKGIVTHNPRGLDTLLLEFGDPIRKNLPREGAPE